MIPKTIFACEKLSPALVSEMVPLIAEHFEEIALFHNIKLEPDFELYKKLANGGALKIFTARMDRQLIGYSVFTLMMHRHYMSSLQAVEELLYLSRKHRKGSLGENLIQFCDDQLKEMGAQVIYHTVSSKRDFSMLLIRKGYDLVERVYAKQLR